MPSNNLNKNDINPAIGSGTIYNFDEIIDRHNTDAIKIERCKALFGTENIIPLWVADMDFRTPDFILNAIYKRLEHPILGYSKFPKELMPSLVNWIKKLHNWDINPDWAGFVPGIVSGIAFAIDAYTQTGDEIIIQPPVYYPFMDIINKSHRKLIYNQLVEKNGKFEMDFTDLEQKITDKTRLFILCNPHNPGGRAWDKASLQQLCDICSRHNVLVISDEIHSDLVLTGHTHTPFASISETASNISVTFQAPTKTFNMPGLVSSSYIIPNRELRFKYAQYLDKIEQAGGNIFAYVATQSAYQYGEEWRQQMLEYVENNLNYVIEFLATNIPQIKPMQPEATYLLWLNCRELGMETDELHQFFARKAGLGLNKGTVFGPGGEYHLRLNAACPRSVLEQAMKQLQLAIKSL